MDFSWPTLSARTNGQRLVSFRYDLDAGSLVVELENGELWVSADCEGCHVIWLDNGRMETTTGGVEDL